jgi:hypothetical protein
MPLKKKLNNKQGTENDMKQRGWGALSTPEKGGGKSSQQTLNKQSLQQ